MHRGELISFAGLVLKLDASSQRPLDAATRARFILSDQRTLIFPLVCLPSVRSRDLTYNVSTVTPNVTVRALARGVTG